MIVSSTSAAAKLPSHTVAAVGSDLVQTSLATSDYPLMYKAGCCNDLGPVCAVNPDKDGMCHSIVMANTRALMLVLIMIMTRLLLLWMLAWQIPGHPESYYSPFCQPKF